MLGAGGPQHVVEARPRRSTAHDRRPEQAAARPDDPDRVEDELAELALGAVRVVRPETHDDDRRERRPQPSQLFDAVPGSSPDSVVLGDLPAGELLAEIGVDSDVEGVTDERDRPRRGRRLLVAGGHERVGADGEDGDDDECEECAHGRRGAKRGEHGSRGFDRCDRAVSREPGALRVDAARVPRRPRRLRLMAARERARGRRRRRSRARGVHRRSSDEHAAGSRRRRSGAGSRRSGP